MLASSQDATYNYIVATRIEIEVAAADHVAVQAVVVDNLGAVHVQERSVRECMSVASGQSKACVFHSVVSHLSKYSTSLRQ